MPSRQDQLHSYQYSVQRVVAALVTHDPDPHRSPLRRAGMTALISLVIAALAVGAAAIYGLLTGSSSTNVRDESAVFLEKGSGARYVYLASDQKLHPVLNYASGLLIANATEPKLVSTTRKKLATVPLGDPVGIPDAPDSLPGAGKDDLLTGPWSICTATPDVGARPRSTVLVGDAVTDGTVASPDTGAGQALVVRDAADRDAFLVYGNRRFHIPGNRYDAVLRAFGWGDRQAWPVAAAWINAIPVGPDVRPLDIDGFGRQSGVPQAPQIGRLLTDGNQWAVALADGAAAVTDVQALLLQTNPDAFTPVTVEGQVFNNLPGSATRLSDAGDADGLPSTVPALAATPTRACMTLPVGRNGAGIRINPTVPAGTAVSGTTGAPGDVQADLVYVPRGKGAVVAAAASPTARASTGTVSIVTDTGRRYPVASREVLAKLGYGGVSPKQVPSQLVALLPQGPSLDPSRARQAL
ncbi:MAG TPA: type VII secretion protein EccB [Actinoplanes sp.]